tara:strand:- start:530 stop:1387 length:858 start_codon:yes stop_codon:yes gene_type:complete
MPRQNVETAAMNYVGLRQVVDDFIITMDGDDYVSNVSDVAIRNIALRGIREFGFDVTNRVRSLKLSVESNNTVTLPDDYVDLIKIGIVTDGIVYVLGENKNLNMSMAVVTGDDAGVGDSQLGPLNIEANEIADRDRSVEDTAGTSGDGDKDYDYYVFQNYLYQGGLGRLYGAGGGHLRGEYRIDLDQNRIEMSTEDAISEVVLEYVADEARNTFPVIHVYAEEALRCYLYYKLIERKSTVPAGEKARARAEYYNERRKAKGRMSNFTKTEALKTIRQNFKQSPKY